MDFVSLKDKVVASLSGHVIEFKKGIVVSVPDDELLLKALREEGVLPAEDVDPDVLSVLRGNAPAVVEAPEAPEAPEVPEAPVKTGKK